MPMGVARARWNGAATRIPTISKAIGRLCWQRYRITSDGVIARRRFEARAEYKTFSPAI